ncbi:alcohol dehydrogenase catalytic domain-containing protein [Mycobacterium ulcerans]|uniref:alcohol dehydrogenase catalytic domain-containing protein n=1 Tax=Mycobacterium ulcerans TaxID=1809 RepID=UPI001E5E5CC1|nr:alcohol dehydrogenase catalytic domain-containing protein [Mycobacterium ulcerans]MEB3979099.1 alcohol dehydrogenase catalytic domain-containing protein [Mycobacterium ulcerans]MEB4436094.1 alcohol dehydrogenase catalytic domain-containing protein [Mycobacterium ulcerans]
MEGLGSHYERELREQLRGGSCYADRGFSESWLDERLVFCADSSADIDCLRCTAHVRRAAQGDRMTDNGYRALVRRPAGPDGCSLVDVAVLDTPALEPGDLLLAPLVAGICGTDWQILRGDRPDDSPVLGHEGIARVVVGSKAFAPGDIVTVNPTHPTDPGFLLGHNVAGLWAERTRIPASVVNAGLVVSVPSSAANDVLSVPLPSRWPRPSTDSRSRWPSSRTPRDHWWCGAMASSVSSPPRSGAKRCQRPSN